MDNNVIASVYTLHNVGYENNVYSITSTSYLAVLLANNVKEHLYNYSITIQDVHYNIIGCLSNLQCRFLSSLILHV